MPCNTIIGNSFAEISDLTMILKNKNKKEKEKANKLYSEEHINNFFLLSIFLTYFHISSACFHYKKSFSFWCNYGVITVVWCELANCVIIIIMF